MLLAATINIITVRDLHDQIGAKRNIYVDEGISQLFPDSVNVDNSILFIILIPILATISKTVCFWG